MTTVDEYAEDVIAPRISMVERRLAGAACRARRNTRCACRSIPRSCRPQQIGINEIDQALQNWNVNLPTGQLFGPHDDLQHRGQRAS